MLIEIVVSACLMGEIQKCVDPHPTLIRQAYAERLVGEGLEGIHQIEGVPGGRPALDEPLRDCIPDQVPAVRR
jgi:hypothetical protein